MIVELFQSMSTLIFLFVWKKEEGLRG